jgi:ATP/maltotriose-dependent transcriptional regulator MalT
LAGGVLAGLAELRRRQGRWKDAEQLLDQATGDAVLVCRSRLARDRGDAQRALALAERALRQTPEHMVVQRAPTLEALIAAAADRGDWPRAHAALTELKTLARVVDTAPLRAAVSLAQGMLAAATGDQEHARRLLEDAVNGFERSGAPFEAAEARLELSKSLTALGWTAEAAEETRTALERLRELGVDAEERQHVRNVYTNFGQAVSRTRGFVGQVVPEQVVGTAGSHAAA